MIRPVAHLLDEALQLPESEAASLAARLIESLDPTIDDDADSAWSEELRRRLGELDNGQAPRRLVGRGSSEDHG